MSGYRCERCGEWVGLDASGRAFHHDCPSWEKRQTEVLERIASALEVLTASEPQGSRPKEVLGEQKPGVER
jgi:hypothetical protein